MSLDATLTQPARRAARRGAATTAWRPAQLARGTAILVYAVACGALLVLRRPDALTHAQFWAEDGMYWFGDAYNMGLQALVTPHTGYFQTLSRFSGELGVLVGIGNAPLAMNSVALAVHLAPSLFIVSRRFEHLIPSLATRCLLGFLFIVIPNSEAFGNITNGHWFLATLALMVLVARPARTRAGQVGDMAVFLLCSLSGPFVIAFVPIAFFMWRATRSREHLAFLAAGVPIALLQGISTLANMSSRAKGPLGANTKDFIRIVSDRIVVPAATGRQSDLDLYSISWGSRGLLWATLIALAGAAIVGVAALWGPLELKLTILFGGFVLLITLLSPQIHNTLPQWPLMTSTLAGERYFVIPVITFTLCVVWAISRLPYAALRGAVAVPLLALLLYGAGNHWQYTPYGDLHPERNVTLLDRAPSGSVVTLTDVPGWTFQVTKR